MHVCTRYLANNDWRMVVVLKHMYDVHVPSTDLLVLGCIEGG